MGRRPSDRPVHIVDAALHAFAEHGFDGATWRMIADRAGVAQGLLTYHFGDKEALWREAYRTARARKMAANPPVPVLDEDGPPPTRGCIEAWLSAYCESFARHPELARMQVAEGQDGSPRTDWTARDTLKEDYDRFVRGLTRLQAHGFFEGVAPHHLVYMLVGAAQYAFLVPGQMRLLTGQDPRSDACIRAHAQAVTDLFMSRA